MNMIPLFIMESSSVTLFIVTLAVSANPFVKTRKSKPIAKDVNTDHPKGAIVIPSLPRNLKHYRGPEIPRPDVCRDWDDRFRGLCVFKNNKWHSYRRETIKSQPKL